MAESTESLFVARSADIEFLTQHYEAAAGGAGRTVLVQAPLGGGKRALVGELLRSLNNPDALIWRVSLIEEEDGLRTLLRMYASLYAALHRDQLLRGRVEMILNAQLPKRGQREQQWYRAFIDGLRKGAPKDGEEGFQVSLPRDNPVVGLVEIISGIARKLTIVMDVQNAHSVQSVAVQGIFEALMHRAGDMRLLQVLTTEPVDDVRKAWFPSPFLDFLERRGEELHTLDLAPWGEAETQQYLDSKGVTADAAALTRIADGRPGFIAELADLAGADEGLDLSEATFASLLPRELDEDELEAEPGEKNGRKIATAEDLDDVAFRAALLGRAFPSGLLADIGGYDRDSIDDLLDAAEDLFKEMQFSKGLNTWIYQFKRAAYREGALAHARTTRDDADQVTIATATFLERFLAPRGYEFVVKTARMFAEAGQTQRAMVMRSRALSADRQEVWAMSLDLMRYFQDVPWPDPMRRTVYMNLMDRMAALGKPEQAESLFNEILEWADSKEDRPLKAWLLFAGSRLDFRRQDYYRARDRANDALTLYSALGDQLKPAELLNHLALIDFRDGNPTAARQNVDKALEAGKVETADGPRVLPQVAANAEFIRGLLDKRERKFKEAAEHFRLANEIAGRSAQAPLALESGLNFGECLLASGDSTKAADVLQRVLAIAQSLQNGVAQRAAAALLAQAHGGLRQYEAALKWAKATLDMTRQLKFERFIPLDTFNVGLFTMLQGKPTEALALFREARKGANLQADAVFAKELLYNQAMAALRIGETGEAQEAFSTMLPAARASKDHRKLVAALLNLGNIAANGGDKASAKGHFEAAQTAADGANLKEEAKTARKRLREL